MKAEETVLYVNHTRNMAQPQSVITRTASRSSQGKVTIYLNGKIVTVPANSCTLLQVVDNTLVIDPAAEIKFRVMPPYANFG